MAIEDFVIPGPNVLVTAADQQMVIEPMLQSFREGGDADMTHVFEESRQLLNDGVVNAFQAPVAHFAVNVALGIITLPEVEEQVPSEVEARYTAVSGVIEQVITPAMAGDITAAYEKAGIYKLGSGSRLKHLTSASSIQGLAKGVFKDTTAIAGGALKLLKDEHPKAENPAEIIKRSKGLLVASKILQLKLPAVYRTLGVPYIFTENLKVSDSSPEGLRVRFSKTALDTFKGGVAESKYDGCPVGKMPALGHGTVLQETFGKVVGYLVPPNASVDAYLGSPEEFPT